MHKRHVLYMCRGGFILTRWLFSYILLTFVDQVLFARISDLSQLSLCSHRLHPLTRSQAGPFLSNGKEIQPEEILMSSNISHHVIRIVLRVLRFYYMYRVLLAISCQHLTSDRSSVVCSCA